jgi:hypothetical protein
MRSLNLDPSPLRSKAIRAIAGPLFAVGLINCGPEHTANTPSTPAIYASPTTELARMSDLQVLQLESNKLNIQIDRQEIAEWQKLQPLRNVEREALPTIVDRGKERFNNVLNLMLASKNPHYQQTAQNLHTYFSQGDASWAIYRKVVTAGQETEITIVPSVQNGKMHFHVVIGGEWLLSSKGIDAANTINHEGDHLASSFRRINKNKTPDEQLAEEKEAITSPRAHLIEESRAYAAEVQGYVYQYALGIRDMDNDGVSLAATYIRRGKNPLDPEWQRFIARKINVPFPA